MSIGGILASLLIDLGRKADAASATGSANAKLAQLSSDISGLKRAATFASYVNVISNEATGTVSIDSGALAAGDYEVVATQNRIQANGSVYNLQHRNAANTADIKFAGLVGVNLYGATFVWWPRTTLALNERIRIINDGIGGAGQFVQLGLFVRLAT